MAAKARILGAWMYIRNPDRSKNDDLNLVAGGVITLNGDALTKLDGNLLTIRIDVMDQDDFSSDDLLVTNQSFQLGAAFLESSQRVPKCFFVDGINVPAHTINNTDNEWSDRTDVYCLISASGGGLTTNTAQSNSESVKLYPD